MKQGVSVPDLDDGEFFLIRLLRNGKMQSLGDYFKILNNCGTANLPLLFEGPWN